MRWVLAAMVAAAVLVFGGTFVYFHFFNSAPKKLSESNGVAILPVVSVNTDGDWTVATDPKPEAGYRVKEILLGQSATAVGRTSSVTGTMSMSGKTISAARITVDLTTVTSDKSLRDSQFQGRIMNTAQFPNAVFTLTQPITLASIPTDNTKLTVKATGTLAMHGATKTVTTDLIVQRTGAKVLVIAEIPVTFGDYNIQNPSAGPAQTGDTGTIEFLAVFAKK